MSSQQEKSILEVQVAVYNYDNNIKNWAPKDGGSSRVFIFHNPNNNSYRIIGQSTADKQYNINTPIKPEMVHKKLRENFVQWRFRDIIYGLSFKTPEDADRFFSMVTKVIERLQGAQATLPTGAQSTQQNLPAPIPTLRPGSSYGVSGLDGAPPQPTGVPPLKMEGFPMAGSGSGPIPARPIINVAPRKTQSTYGTPDTAAPTADPPTTPSSTSNATHYGTLPRRAVNPTATAPVNPANCLYMKDSKDLTPRDLRAREFYTSEDSYMAGLDIIIDKYLEPNKERKVFTQEEVKKIFSNIRPIRNMSADLLGDMRKAMDDWNETTTIGDIFTRMIPFLKIYTEYCNGHKEANQLLDRLKAKRAVATYLKECQAASNSHLDLNALLITPVQRIPRYQMLMKELLKQTDETHPDYGYLTAAGEQIKGITDSINESVLCSDSTKEVEQLKKLIPDITNELALKNVMKTRQLVKHGKALVTSSKQPVKYTYILLFSDMIAFALPKEKSTKKLEIKERLRLHTLWVENTDGIAADKTWQISSPDATYLIEALAKDDKTLWMDKTQQRITASAEKKGCFSDSLNVQTREFKYTFPDKSVYRGTWTNASMNGYGAYQFANGNFYTGTWESGKFNGKGVMTYLSGEVFDGEWSKGVPHGQGILTTSTATYNGGWDNGTKHGKGTITWANNDRFDGEFVNGSREGTGTLQCSDGSNYSGDWKNDMEDGKGVMTTCYGTYTGDWAAGQKTGSGIMQYTNGDVYTGSWQKDQKSGIGTMVQHDGVKYEGGWQNDLYDGNGVLTKAHSVYEGDFKSGRLYGQGKLVTDEGTYEGQWADDRREGKGTWNHKSGVVYEGEWHSDLWFGKGMLLDVDKSRYDGKFVKGRKEGTGVLTYPSGAKYSGNWQRDKRHGKGIFEAPVSTSADSSLSSTAAYKYHGDWVEDIRDGKGTFTDATGTYDGDWKLDMRNGQGKFTYTNGNSFTGTWKDDKRHGRGVLSILSKEGVPTVINADYDNGALRDPSFAVSPPDITAPRVLSRK